MSESIYSTSKICRYCGKSFAQVNLIKYCSFCGNNDWNYYKTTKTTTTQKVWWNPLTWWTDPIIDYLVEPIPNVSEKESYAS